MYTDSKQDGSLSKLWLVLMKYVKKDHYNAYLPGACPSSGTFSDGRTGIGFYGVGQWDNCDSLDMSK